MPITIPVDFDSSAANLDDDLTRKAGAGGEKAGKKFGGAFSGSAKKLIGGALAAVGTAKVVGFLKDSIGEAREAQKVTALTVNTIKQTGGAAKVTAEQVGALSSAISNKVGIDDEAIQSGANLLLTFKNVRNEAGKGSKIFDRATQAAVDLSAAGFGDLKGASLQLGKALNDPVKGIAALGRAGVTFTTQQKAQIKALVQGGDANAAMALGLIDSTTTYNNLLKQNKNDVRATANALKSELTPAQQKMFDKYSEGNDVLAAQKIVLKEVESQIGGSAEAQVTAADKAKVAFGNLKEEIGAALLPTVDKLSRFATSELIPAVSELVREFQAGEGAGGDIRNVLEQVVSVGKDVGAVLLTVGGAIADIPGPVLKMGAEVAIAALAFGKLITVFKLIRGSAIVSSLFATTAATTAAGGAATVAAGRYAALGRAARLAGGVGGLLLIADSGNRASKSMSALQGAAGGALTGAALGSFGGPPGAAIGAGIGAIAGGLAGLALNSKKSGDAARDLTTDWAQYSDTLNEATAATTKQTEAFTFQRLATDKTLDASRSLGITDREIVRGIAGNRKEREKFITTLGNQRKATETARQAGEDEALARFKAGEITQTVMHAQIRTVQSEADARNKNIDSIYNAVNASKAERAEKEQLIRATFEFNAELKKLPENKRVAIEAVGLLPTTQGVTDLASAMQLTKEEVKILINSAGPTNAANIDIDKVLKNLDKLKAPRTPVIPRGSIQAANSAVLTLLRNLNLVQTRPNGPGLDIPFVSPPDSGGGKNKDDRRLAPGGASAPNAAPGPIGFGGRQAAPVQITQNFNGPTTGRQRNDELMWSLTYGTRARVA